MAKSINRAGELQRGTSTSPARSAVAKKLSGLRGKEGAETVKGSAFGAAVNVAKRFKPAKEKS